MLFKTKKEVETGKMKGLTISIFCLVLSFPLISKGNKKENLFSLLTSRVGIDNFIKELSDKFPEIKKKRMVVFDFLPLLEKEKLGKEKKEDFWRKRQRDFEIWISKNIAERFFTKLVEKGFNVLERRLLEQVIKEQGLQTSVFF